MSDPSRVVVSGPLSAFAPEFLEALLRRGYRPGTAAKQLQLMVHLSRWMAAQDLEPADLGSVEIERFLRERRATGRLQLASARALVPLLGYLRGLGVAPPAGSREAPTPAGAIVAAEERSRPASNRRRWPPSPRVSPRAPAASHATPKDRRPSWKTRPSAPPARRPGRGSARKRSAASCAHRAPRSAPARVASPAPLVESIRTRPRGATHSRIWFACSRHSPGYHPGSRVPL
jgi:hypothetical protein